MKITRERETLNPTPAGNDAGVSARINYLFGLIQGADEPVDWVPWSDFSEHPDGYHIYVELPGVKKRDIRVDMENGELVVRGRRRPERGAAAGHHEPSCGSFKRRFELPEEIGKPKIRVRFHDGMLDVLVVKHRGEPANEH